MFSITFLKKGRTAYWWRSELTNSLSPLQTWESLGKLLCGAAPWMSMDEIYSCQETSP